MEATSVNCSQPRWLCGRQKWQKGELRSSIMIMNISISQLLTYCFLLLLLLLLPHAGNLLNLNQNFL